MAEIEKLQGKTRVAIERELKKKPAGKDPEKTFFLAVSIGEFDGSIYDFSGEGIEGAFATEQAAVEELVELNEQYPTLEGYVYRCIPVRKIWRGNVISEEIKPRKRDKSLAKEQANG